MKSYKKSLHISLYDDPSSKTLDLKAIASYLEDTFLVGVEVKPNFEFHQFPKPSLEEVSRRIASARVRNPQTRFVASEPLYGEIELEKRLIKDPERRSPGVVYDGFELGKLYSQFLKEEEAGLDHMNIAFTNRLIGTYDEDDKRYHARVIVCGFPSIISTSGIVEGPAKPKEFYIAIRSISDPSLQSMAWASMKEKYIGRFIDYDDERLTEVLKGYALQAVFYHLFLEPFCQENTCKLYNSRWQEDVLRAQMGEAGFCRRHLEIMKKLRTEEELRPDWIG